MEAKDRFEACAKLAELRLNRWNARRQYEWKINLGVWALLVAGNVYLKGKPPPIWLVLVLLSGYVIFWVRPVWMANRHDRAACIFFLEQAEKIWRDHAHTPAPTDQPHLLVGARWWFGFLLDWAVQFQIATTAFLILVLFVLPAVQ